MQLFGKPKQMVMVPESGPQIGYEIPIPGTDAIIGGEESNAAIVLRGTTPLLEHARIRSRGSGWTISRRRRDAIFVDGEEIRETAVTDGMTVAFGSPDGAGIRVTFRETDTPVDVAQDGANPLEAVQKYGLYAVFGLVYLGVIYAGYVYLKGGGGYSAGELDRDEIAGWVATDFDQIRAMHATGGPVLVNIKHFEGRVLCGTPHRIGTEVVSDQQYETLRENLTCEVANAFFDAWKLEEQRRWDEALTIYREIVELLPNPDMQTTQAALERINYIE